MMYVLNMHAVLMFMFMRMYGAGIDKPLNMKIYAANEYNHATTVIGVCFSQEKLYVSSQVADGNLVNGR